MLKILVNLFSIFFILKIKNDYYNNDQKKGEDMVYRLQPGTILIDLSI